VHARKRELKREGPCDYLTRTRQRSARTGQTLSRSYPAASDLRKCVAGECRRCSRKGSRHAAAVHLLEAGVDVNVISGRPGHAVSLNTTNRYAEFTMRMKTEAMKLCAPNGVDEGAS
jgi:site-specific recombinase XerD